MRSSLPVTLCEGYKLNSNRSFKTTFNVGVICMSSKEGKKCKGIIMSDSVVLPIVSEI